LSLFNELKRRNVFRVGVAYLVAAWLLMQVADVILNNIEAPDWVFHAILLVLGIGFPLILLFAWAFEMTPEGLKREREVDRQQSITPQTGKKLNHIIIGVMALALAYFAYDKFVAGRDVVEDQQTAAARAGTQPGVAEEQQKSIAVLPLANRSAREEDQFFTDGIHDDLLTQLSKIADLKVISRTSVMRYRDTELPIPEIAKQLGVSTILEGGIQRSGNQVRINMQLIEAGTDRHLWAETYDRQLTAENLFAIQTEITRSITNALKTTLSPEEVARIETRQTNNLEALQELMRGQQLLALRQVEAMEEGKAHFEQALELDPQFAQAMVGLANAHHLLNEYASVPEAESIIPAMGWLGRALDIDPHLGEAYMVRGELYRHLEDWEASEADFLKAIELIPGNASAYHWYSNLKSQQDLEEEAHELLRKAHELDPMSPIIHVNLAAKPFYHGDDEASLAELKRVQQLHPDFYVAHLYEGFIHWAHGDPVGSLRSHLKVLELDPRTNRSGFHCFDYLNLGALEASRKCIGEYQGALTQRRAYIQVLLALAGGDQDTAITVFDASADMPGDDRWLVSGAMALGRYDFARPFYEQEFPAWFGEQGVGMLDADDLNDALDVAAILLAEGNAERSSQLLDLALQVIGDLPRNRGGDAFGYSDVQAYALLGQREAALLALEECAELGYLSGWQELGFHPFYDSIRDDPRFGAAVTRLDIAANEARARAVDEGLL
jgi:TolB-like protein